MVYILGVSRPAIDTLGWSNLFLACHYFVLVCVCVCHMGGCVLKTADRHKLVWTTAYATP